MVLKFYFFFFFLGGGGGGAFKMQYLEDTLMTFLSNKLTVYLNINLTFTVFPHLCKGQLSSKRFFLADDSPKKQTKTRPILVKTNSFVRFLGESSARKKRFEIT